MKYEKDSSAKRKDLMLEEKIEHKRWLIERKKCWNQWKGDLDRAEELLQ